MFSGAALCAGGWEATALRPMGLAEMQQAPGKPPPLGKK